MSDFTDALKQFLDHQDELIRFWRASVPQNTDNMRVAKFLYEWAPDEPVRILAKDLFPVMKLYDPRTNHIRHRQFCAILRNTQGV